MNQADDPQTPIEFHALDISDLDAEKAMDRLLNHASEVGASDLFLLANRDHYKIEMRRMGMVEPVTNVSRDQGAQLVNFIKSAAELDLTEKRRPVDGRLHRPDNAMDVRVNTLGTLHGEDLALRILTQRQRNLPLDDLGFVADQQMQVAGMLTGSSGLILVTGPTGAGKTTTLYSCLGVLNNGARKINTLEDPVEYEVKGLRQTQTQARTGLGFDDLLRGALRQSPDVIMIGEVRDEITADIAVRAANSGHLVLSTLHAPVAAYGVQSLLALGVNPYYLANALLGVLAQRLVRMLHPRSRIAYDAPEAMQAFEPVRKFLHGGQGDTLYGPDPNDRESQGGYSGQTGLFEVMRQTRSLKEKISQGRPAGELNRVARDNGMLDLYRAGLIKVAQGITSLEEISRVIPGDLDLD